VAILLPLGVGVGTIGATVGIGGGILLVPALLILYPDAAPAVITSMSLTAVVLNALSASFGYYRRGWHDPRTGAIVVVAAIPAAIGGAFLTRSVARESFELYFGIALTAGALYLAWRGRRMPTTTVAATTGAVRHIVDRKQAVYDYRVNEVIAGTVALAVGFIAAFFGIGGGIVMVPVMMLVLRMPARMSVATSQLQLLFASVPAVLVHLAATWGDWDSWYRGLIIGVGTLVGAQLGVRLAAVASGKIVLLAISVVLLFVGVREILTGLV
jgi:uncharacterized membrane protein YfcA